MSKLPILPLWTDAFLADTGHLSAQETGCYLLLMMAAWRSEGCVLPDDDLRLARWARVSANVWGRIKPQVMAFWALNDAGMWVQKRLSKEFVSSSERASINRVNGLRGGRPKSLKNKDGANPAGLRNGTQDETLYIHIQNKKPPTPSGGGASHVDFQAFKEAYPKRDGAHDWTKARERFARIVKAGTDPQTLIEAARAYKAETDRTNTTGTRFVKQASTFLADAWRDYAEMQGAAAQLVNPPGWPSNLPAMANVKAAWARGQWPGNWGAEPGDPACRVPPAFLEQWHVERAVSAQEVS